MTLIEFLTDFRSIIGQGDIEKLLSDPRHVTYFDGENAALFIYERPGIYTGHYFFTCRGKEARNLGQKWLKEFFDQYPVVAVRGFTPLENRPARLMTRWLGFKAYGALETPAGWCEFFLLTRPDVRKDV